MSAPSTESPRTISRRTLAQGVAWSVPALALATAAPSFATSPADGATCGTVPVVTVSATEGGSPGAVNQTNPSTGLHSLA